MRQKRQASNFMNRVKWGILGAGGIADRRTLPGMLLAENAEIYAVMELDEAAAGNLGMKYRAGAVYTNEDDLINDPRVDAVYIASPVVCHARQVEKAARQKKHILVEKPVAMNSGESARLCELCRKEGVLLATGLMMRFHTYHQQMKQLIAEGKLGQIVSCHAQFTCWYPDIKGSWRQAKASAGGGAMTDMGIHCLDLIEYITGSHIALVGGLCDTMTFSYDVEDSASALFKLENGAFATVDANFNIPDEAAKCRLEIYGTRGSIRAEGTIGQTEGGTVLVTLSEEDKGYNAIQDRNVKEDLQLAGADGNMYTKEIVSFSKSIINKTEAEVPAEDAARIQSVIEAIYESSESGRFLKVQG